MLLRLAAAALAFVAGSTLWAATSMFEGNTARADGPGLLGGDDSGSLLGGLAGGEGGLLDTVGSLPADLELTTAQPEAAASPPAEKPAPLLDLETLLNPSANEGAGPLETAGSVLQPTLEAVTPTLEAPAEIVNSTRKTPLVSGVLETADPVLNDVLATVDSALEQLPAILEPVTAPLAPVLDPLAPVLDPIVPEGSAGTRIIDTLAPVLNGEKPQNPAVPGGDPKAAESPVPAPEQPSVPAKPSANPALPSSSAPARNAVFDPSTGPENPTEGIANPGPARAPAVPNDPSFAVPGLETATVGGAAFAFALAAGTGVNAQTEVLAMGEGNAASGTTPIDIRGGHAMAAASGMSPTFSSSAGTFAVLAMALAVGILALTSRRVNLEWLVPPSRMWAPEVPPAR